VTPSPPPAGKPAALSDEQEARALSFQHLIMARLIGKACLGIGFITAIVGITGPAPMAIRTGLALLLVGIIASFVSLVQDFRHRRLLRRSTAGPTRPPAEQPPRSS